MCDDLDGVSNCGLDSVALDTFITAQIELKRLKFHTPYAEGKSKFVSLAGLGVNIDRPLLT